MYESIQDIVNELLIGRFLVCLMFANDYVVTVLFNKVRCVLYVSDVYNEAFSR